MDFVSDSLADDPGCASSTSWMTSHEKRWSWKWMCPSAGRESRACSIKIAQERGAYPYAIVCDNGPEFISLALDLWSDEHGVPRYSH